MSNFRTDAFDDAEALGQAKMRFIEEWENGKRPTVQQYTQEYPQFAEEMADFILTFVVMERAARGEKELLEPTNLSARALERARALRPSAAKENTLLDMVKTSGISLAGLAERLKLSPQAVQQIIRGQVSPAPPCLPQLLAWILKRPADEVRAAISRLLPRQAMPAGHYRALGKGGITLPELKQRSFKEMLALCTDLPVERRELWEHMANCDNLSTEQKKVFGWEEEE